MAQKVQLLACIAHDPEFVILDEPFSGLDPVNQQVMEDIIRDMARRNRTVLFSTHVMQHAERLCDRIVLIAKGRKIFDGGIPQAKRIIPRRVLIATGDDVASIRGLGEVASMRALEKAEGAAQPGGPQPWELELRENADPQAILQFCFARGIRLQSFHETEPTLHEAFMRLVGTEAAEGGSQ
jgi:ABC-2 type transport system ATP-binding protein